jgi:hypothetical protein
MRAFCNEIKCVPLTRFTIRASVSSYSALPAFIWRLPTTSIAGSTARRTAATKTKICKMTVKPRPAKSRHGPRLARQPHQRVPEPNGRSSGVLVADVPTICAREPVIWGQEPLEYSDAT